MDNKEYFKITKIKSLKEVNNDMVDNYYCLVYGRLYNNEHTMYRKFKFVLFVDMFNVQEYFEKDVISKKDIKDYLDIYALSTCLSYELDENGTYYDKDKLKEFYDFCNKTIDNYNN